MNKKTLSLALALILFIIVSIPASGLGLVFYDLDYGTDWYCSDVYDMVSAGYINGYPDGDFRGESNISAAEFITILAKYKGLPTGSGGGHWAGQQIEAALYYGWYDSSDFIGLSFDDALPRQVAAKILVNALGLSVESGPYDLPFYDESSIAEEYLPYVSMSYEYGIFRGDSDGNFYPRSGVIRGQAAALIKRAIMLENGGGIPEAPYGTFYSHAEIIDYFCEIALKSEYGDRAPAIIKWTQPIYYYISGSPTSEDMTRLLALMAAMNKAEGFPGIYPSSSKSGANMQIEFLSTDDMDYFFGSYMPNHQGGVMVWYNSYNITNGKVGYLAQNVSQGYRNTVICEELIQSTGLLNDSYGYPDSIFYQYDTNAVWPSALDWIVFQLLYDPAISPGMSETACRDAITNILNNNY